MSEHNQECIWFLQTHLSISELKTCSAYIFNKSLNLEFDCESFFESLPIEGVRIRQLLSKYQKYLNTLENKNENIFTRVEIEQQLSKPLPESSFVALQFLGNKHALARPVVSIIGSRHPTYYGREQAHIFAKALAKAGCTVLSGGAIGVDAIACATAIEAGGRTGVVIGSGLERLYPASNAWLFQRLQEETTGFIFSEFSSCVEPQKWNFPRRNQVLACLSDFVFIVEAAERSGSLITAQAALDLGIDVGAMPGNIDNVASMGTNQLIQNGAFCITRPQDILERIQFLT